MRYYTDHTGHRFSSLATMCKHWRIDKELFNSRIANCWTMEDTLTTPEDRIRKRTDFNGVEYRSEKEMCAHFKVRVEVYRSRLELYWTQEEALMTRDKFEKVIAGEDLIYARTGERDAG